MCDGVCTTTHTPAPQPEPTPEPGPQQPKASNPKKPGMLASTGASGALISTSALALAGGALLVGARRRRDS